VDEKRGTPARITIGVGVAVAVSESMDEMAGLGEVLN
jgi:hypothetical protein